jgi:hypothetical protein
MIIILFIILFYLLTPGILIKMKGNKYVIAIVHAILFSGIITYLNSILNTRYEYMTDTNSTDISNTDITISDVSNNTTNDTNMPKLMGMTKCPKYQVHANGGLESDCVKCPVINGLPLGVMGKYALCAFSNSIDNHGYVETIEEGGTCSDTLDTPVSIGKTQFCISNTSIQTSEGLDKFNKITTPSNITYYQSN